MKELLKSPTRKSKYTLFKLIKVYIRLISIRANSSKRKINKPSGTNTFGKFGRFPLY